MIGYVLEQEHFIMPEFFASWQELVETLSEMGEMDSPNERITIEPCVYYKSDFKEKKDE